MDAPHDRDIELQRESGDLIKELETKLPPLLWKAGSRQPHRWARSAKTDKLLALLEPFQEWPQLLDPHLQGLLTHLTGAFLAYLAKYSDLYAASPGQDEGDSAIYPLPRAICKLLYVLCKVRGVKVIIRFLNNEPKYLEPLLRAFIAWDSIVSKNPVKSHATGQGSPLVWEERYIMLLWLSHLLLAPFDLSSISSDDIPMPSDNYTQIPNIPSNLPRVALSLISISLKYVVLPGKEMEAATSLLARLALRLDMRRLGLLDSMVSWALGVLHPNSGQKHSVFGYIGILSFVARVGSLGHVDDLGPYVVPIFDRILKLSPEEPHISSTLKSSAAARKLIIKILRTMTLLTLSVEERPDTKITGDQVSRILEDAIDHLLVALADNYTPVRLAASKALSLVTLKLGRESGADVVDAVIGSLDEKILYEKADGSLISRSEAHSMDSRLRKRNTSAVDPQKWHGLILTLAHLLFRRSPPTDQLDRVLESLASGLDFEQRLASGASVGGNVRDAACFGVWSIARKYTTSELCHLDSQGLKITLHQGDSSILQSLAVELVGAACLDPSGNIRRGASAALQELIGRHPNTILEGIPLVQVVDYHSVARRSRAMVEVARGAACLGEVYWTRLVDGLLQWKGVASPESDSRRAAADAFGSLSTVNSYKSIYFVLKRLRDRLFTLPAHSFEKSHGCLLSLAATVNAFISHKQEIAKEEVDSPFAEKAAVEISRLWEVIDSPTGFSRESLTRTEFRPHLAAEAVSHLLSALARSCAPGNLNTCGIRVPRPSDAQLEAAIDVLMLCVPREGHIPIEASSRAASDLFALIFPTKQVDVIQRWLDNIHSSWKLQTGQGQISALGAVFPNVPATGPERQYIIQQLFQCTGVEEKILKRVAAVKCFTTDILGEIDDVVPVVPMLIGFLDDYTTYRRGDIGSLIRTEALNGVKVILEKTSLAAPAPSFLEDLMKCVIRLAAEKLDKVRLQAWKCLQLFWQSTSNLPPLEVKYDYFSDVSSHEYFLQLFRLFSVDWIRFSLTKGLVTSASAGSEGLVRATRFALVEYIHNQDPQEQDKLKIGLVEDLTLLLEDTMDDDRYAIPTVDFLAFLLDTLFLTEHSPEPDVDYNKIFTLTQKFHFKSSNLPRIEAAIRVYGALRRVKRIRRSVTKKMASMLVHPYPKIRFVVAESLFMETDVKELKMENWSMPPKQLKPAVEKVRDTLAIPAS